MLHAVIEKKVKASLAPELVVLENESKNHAVPLDSETHFKLTVVTSVFEGKSLVERHRLVYASLQAELSNGIHALALHTFTPEEWNQRPESAASPLCLGGSKHKA